MWLRNPNLTERCDDCLHTYGSHFRTFDGASVGCAVLDDDYDCDHCRCDGFFRKGFLVRAREALVHRLRPLAIKLGLIKPRAIEGASNYVAEIWGSELEKLVASDLKLGLAAGLRAAVDRSYEGDIRGGDTIHIPPMVEPGAEITVDCHHYNGVDIVPHDDDGEDESDDEIYERQVSEGTAYYGMAPLKGETFEQFQRRVVAVSPLFTLE